MGGKKENIKLSEHFFISTDAPDSQSIVEIGTFQRVRHSLEISIEDKIGNILPIIGTRGIGKSTCLEFCDHYVKNKLNYDCSRLLNIGLVIPDFSNKDHDERINIILNEIALCLSNKKTRDLKSVIESLNKSKLLPFFLFIDNLDRLYQTEDDLSFIKYFFRKSDPILKELSKKVAIYISCAPEWTSILKLQDLSYLNYSNSIELNPLNKNEIKKLIENRAITYGYKIDDIIDTNLLKVLRVASGGNPRSIFQFLKKVASEKKLPIDKNKFHDVLKVETYSKSNKKLTEIASTSAKVCWGINQLWRYFDNLQKSGIDNPTGISKIIKAYNNNHIDESEIKRFRSVWTRISHSISNKKWVLNPQVKETLRNWIIETELPLDLLLTAFSENPFTVSKTVIEDYVDLYRDALENIDDAFYLFNKSLENFMFITSIIDVENKRNEIINSCWNCINELMLTILSIEEGAVPRELNLKLEKKKIDVETLNELIDSIDEIYADTNKNNKYRADLKSILERYRDINENPGIIEHLEKDQLEGLKKQVLTSYEGLIRTLKPKLLLSTSKHEKIESINKIVKSRGKENNKVEFKSTIRINLHTMKPDKAIEHSVLKTITAFLNTDGGILLIGVNDDGKSIGIEKDISTLKKRNIDGFKNYIMDITAEHIGSEKSVYIDSEAARYNGSLVCMHS